MRIQRHQRNSSFGTTFGLGTWLANRSGGMGAMINGPGTSAYVPTSLDPTSQPSKPIDTMAVLNKAKSALLAAGYEGAECHEETVYYPNGGGGSYTQQICSAPGYSGGSEANLVALMTPQQLAAQRSYELAHGAGNEPSYFEQTAGAPNISVGTSTSGASAPGTQGNVAPDWFSTLQSQMSNLSTQVTSATSPPATPGGHAPGTQGTGGSTTNTAADSSASGGTIIPGVPDMVLYAGGALALFLILKGGK